MLRKFTTFRNNRIDLIFFFITFCSFLKLVCLSVCMYVCVSHFFWNPYIVQYIHFTLDLLNIESENKDFFFYFFFYSCFSFCMNLDFFFFFFFIFSIPLLWTILPCSSHDFGTSRRDSEPVRSWPVNQAAAQPGQRLFAGVRPAQGQAGGVFDLLIFMYY